MAAVEHQHGRARALVLALDHHQVFMGHVDATACTRCLGAECLVLARFALDGVQQRAGGVEIQCVAELVRLGRSGCLDAGRLLARVVTTEAALAERAQQIAQGAVAEEVERLVGDLEGDGRLLVVALAHAAAALTTLALGVEIRRHGDVALFGHPLDDLLNQLLELRPRV